MIDMDTSFGIFASLIDGSNYVQLAANEWRQLSHPRVSPDGKRFTFTSYFNQDRQGIARETGNYENTAIYVGDIGDNLTLECVVPNEPGYMNCHSSWLNDDELVFVRSVPGMVGVRRFDLVNRKSSWVTHAAYPAVDPHVVGNKLVFVRPGSTNTIWDKVWGESNPRQLTKPKQSIIDWLLGVKMFGDFDPKISPDGQRIAFMRCKGSQDPLAGDWRIYVIELATGKEKCLSSAAGDMCPDWSADGKHLVFTHVESNVKKIGLYRMRADGTNRQLLPLPRGCVPNQASYFPGSNERIIYQAAKNPAIL